MQDISVQRWFIFTTWGMLGVVLGLLVLLYNLYPDRSLDAWVNRWVRAGNHITLKVLPCSGNSRKRGHESETKATHNTHSAGQGEERRTQSERAWKEVKDDRGRKREEQGG